MDINNTRKKILMLGGASLLSFLWCKKVNLKYEIFLVNNQKQTNYLNLQVLSVNLFSKEEIIRILEDFSIDIVVNTVGLTNVEKCEEDPDKAYALNAALPELVAEVCFLLGKKFIHISTDHFFENEQKLHSEDDKVSLLNTYAKSKYEGELRVLHKFPSALICRTNFFGYGPPHKLSFSDWIIKSSYMRNTITLHNDVYFTPINGGLLAILAHRLIDLNCYGVYNISSKKRISKYDFGILLCKLLKLKCNNIYSGSIFQRNDLMLRPTSMSLSNKKLLEKLKIEIDPLEHQIKNMQ